MKQTMVKAVMSGSVMTEDGLKKPIGNRAFAVGDIAWTHGDVLFGHEIGNGTVIPDVGGIPFILVDSPWNDIASPPYHYGIIRNAKAKQKATWHTTENDHRYFTYSRHSFCNDAENAYIMFNNPHSVQYDLINKRIVSNVDTFSILDACVAADGELLMMVNMHKESELYPELAENGYSWQTDMSISCTPDYRLLKNGALQANVGPLLTALVELKASECLAATVGESPVLYRKMAREEQTTVRPDGTYTMKGWCQISTRESSDGIFWDWWFLWTIENGAPQSHLYASRVGSTPNPTINTFTVDWTYPLNDGFSFNAVEPAEMGMGVAEHYISCADVYDPDAVMFADINFPINGYNLFIRCAAKLTEGQYLVNCNGHHSANYNTKGTYLSDQGALTTFFAQPCLNTRFVRCKKLPQLYGGLQTFFEEIVGGV